jgi:O-antigen/teichoic acid export membrane protein
MNASQRLVLNTAATYGRSVFSIALTLFSSRWILASLGQTDYGLFSLVGSIIIIITFLNGVMAGSVSRYFAYSIGQDDSEEVTHWFNTALSLHLCFAVILILFGWPIGRHVIVHFLNIPPDRLASCLGVFHISLLSAFASMISVPFMAMFNAKQHISEIAGWGIVQTILTFALAIMLAKASGDRLLFYAIGMAGIIVGIQIAIIVRAFSVFGECRIVTKAWFDSSCFKRILSFAVWNLIGGTGATFRDQGSAILLNLFFGARVNAAFGIANQVSTQTNQLSAAMLGAFSPEITSSEGRGDRKRMLSLSHRASKFGTILVMLFAIPLIVEMDYILRLWLHIPPPHSALFCRLILCTFLIDRLSTGYMMAVNAYGKIAAYQATVGICLILTLPLAWLFLKWGYPPTSVGIAFMITSAVCTIGRALWMRRLFGEPVSRWIQIVVLPCLIVGTISLCTALIPCWLMTPSFARLIFVSSLSIGAALLAAWLIAFDAQEHAFVRQNSRHLLYKLTKAYNHN